eukprot:767838-Hanusia_phi.AAC.1
MVTFGGAGPGSSDRAACNRAYSLSLSKCSPRIWVARERLVGSSHGGGVGFKPPAGVKDLGRWGTTTAQGHAPKTCLKEGVG